MSRAKIVAAILISLLSSSAASTEIASAASWYVAGVKLPFDSKANLASSAAVDVPMTLNSPSMTTKISCSGGVRKVLEFDLPFIEGENRGGAEELLFLGCSEISPVNCEVNELISTLPVSISIASATGTEDRVTLKPEIGAEFSDLVFRGPSCAIAGEKPVDGLAVLKAPTGQTESNLQPIEGLGTIENNSLELAGHKAYLEGGKTLLRLASGSSWSFH